MLLADDGKTAQQRTDYGELAKNLEQHHFKDFVKMAEHFRKEMLYPVGNATAKSFEFFQVMRSVDGQTPRVACAGLHSRRYI